MHINQKKLTSMKHTYCTVRHTACSDTRTVRVVVRVLTKTGRTLWFVPVPSYLHTSIR